MKSWILLLSSAAALAFSVPGLAQEDDGSSSSDDTSSMSDIPDAAREAEADAKDVIQRAEAPFQEANDDTGTMQVESGTLTQGENAGSFEGTVSSRSGSSHSESRSESSSTSVSIRPNPDAMYPPPISHHPWPSRPDGGNGVEGMTGNWTLGEDGGKYCTTQFSDKSWFGGYSVYVPAGCPIDFVKVGRWILVGNQLQLTSSQNEVFARFWPAGPGRWVGHRESDGAHLYLNR